MARLRSPPAWAASPPQNATSAKAPSATIREPPSVLPSFMVISLSYRAARPLRFILRYGDNEVLKKMATRNCSGGLCRLGATAPSGPPYLQANWVALHSASTGSEHL